MLEHPELSCRWAEKQHQYHWPLRSTAAAKQPHQHQGRKAVLLGLITNQGGDRKRQHATDAYSQSIGQGSPQAGFKKAVLTAGGYEYILHTSVLL